MDTTAVMIHAAEKGEEGGGGRGRNAFISPVALILLSAD